MIANFFKKSSVATTVFLLVLFSLIYVFSILMDIVSFTWLSVLLTLFFIGVALLINKKNNLTFNNSYCFLFLIILIGLFPELVSFNKTLVINILVLFVFRKLYNLQFLAKIDSKIFDAGFWIGVIFILEPLSLFLLVILFAGLILFGHFKIRLFLLALLAVFIAPFLFFTYSFFLGQEAIFYSFFHFDINFPVLSFRNSSVFYNFIFVSFFVFFSIILKSQKALVKNNTFKISWILVLLHFSFSLLLFFSLNEGVHGLLYLLFPTAVILSNGIELYENQPISDVIIILFIINMFVPLLI